jgi:enoyl-CoA hydratase
VAKTDSETDPELHGVARHELCRRDRFQRLADYYGGRARRGVGPIVHEAVSVHPKHLCLLAEHLSCLPWSATSSRVPGRPDSRSGTLRPKRLRRLRSQFAPMRGPNMGSVGCAGADLSESRHGVHRPSVIALLRQIVELPKPVVASLDGHARAGGMGLVGACDIALAGPTSTFAFSEVRLGLAPAMISLTTLPRLSARATSRYYLTGETFDAPTAARIGLITEAVDDIDVATKTVLDALRKASPQGLPETKPLTTHAVAFDDGDALAEQSARLFASDEAREGVTSSLEKRAPQWVL